MTNAHVELSTLGMTNPTRPIPLEQSQGLPVHQEELGISRKCAGRQLALGSSPLPSAHPTMHRARGRPVRPPHSGCKI